MSSPGEMFLKLSKQKFQFLLAEYGFLLKSSKKESGNIYKVAYQNNTTSVYLIWDLRDNWIYMEISRLVNGKPVPNPITINQDTTLNGFNFDLLLLIRQPQRIPDSTPKNIDDVDGILDAYSKLLKAYGSDVLMGDFSVMTDIEKLVKEKAASNKI